ncbi:MAG: hypothetical protein HC880_07425 [Bacteroidia bacterium]|nr:hypothetical protein [Bacteroidia bacterium]
MELIAGFSALGRVVLGLNENEARKLYAALVARDSNQEELPRPGWAADPLNGVG